MAEIKITDNSQLFKDAKNEAVERAMEALAITAEGYAKLKCPVDTGRLRNSITHSVDSTTAYIGTNVEYAAYVEYGTVNTPAQPYLKPAITEHHSEYSSIVMKYLKGG